MFWVVYLFTGFIVSSVIAHLYSFTKYSKNENFGLGDFLAVMVAWPAIISLIAIIASTEGLTKWLKWIQFIPRWQKLDDPVDKPITLGTKYSEFPYNILDGESLKDVIDIDKYNDTQKFIEGPKEDV